PCAVPSAARRLFFVPRLLGALGKLGLDCGQRHTARFQHYKQMIKQVSDLCDESAVVFLHGSHHGFHGLFAQLLGAMIDTLIEQRAGIGILRARFRAFVDPLFKIGQRELAHMASFARSFITDRAVSADPLLPCIPWLAVRCTRRNGRSRPPAPPWHGRRGCPPPCDRACRRRPKRSPAPTRHLPPRGSTEHRSLSWFRRDPSR